MSDGTPVKIVAEAAQGFEGHESLACLLARAAASAKADAIKFQLVYPDELAQPGYPYYALFKKLELPDAAWTNVARQARELGLELIFDVFGLRSAGLARALGAGTVKIHTTDFFNHDLVRQALASFDTVYFSAGGIGVDEVEAFLQRHRPAGGEKLVMLYGFQAEPTAVEDNHLRRLGALRARLPGLRLGFMDHSAGDTDEAGWLAVLCLPYGVEIIEKHITLDRSLQLEDYISALGPEAFGRFVARIRAAETALGRSSLDPTEAERAYHRKVVKKVTTRRDLEAHAVIGAEDVILLRSTLIPTPGDGATMLEDLEGVLGRQTRRAIRAGETLTEDDLK